MKPHICFTIHVVNMCHGPKRNALLVVTYVPCVVSEVVAGVVPELFEKLTGTVTSGSDGLSVPYSVLMSVVSSDVFGVQM